MRVLVTGTKGQLSSCLVERASGRPAVELTAAGLPELDLERRGSASDVIRAAAPEVVIAAAAYTAVDQAEDEPERAFRVNAEAAGEVAAAAAAAGAIVVHLSTDYVFDGRSSAPYGEEDQPNPLGVYGRSKLAGEEQVRAANPRHLIVRTAWVHSPFGRNFVKTMIAAAGTRDRLTVVDDQLGCPTSALALADALLDLVELWRDSPDLGLGETYHLAGAGSVSWCGLARKIMDECRARGLPAAEVQPIRTEDWPTRAPRPRNSALDCSKFRGKFGFALPPWQDSLAEVVDRLAQRE